MKIDLKKMLNFDQTNITGLDIGSSSVKMVQLYKENNSYAARWAGIRDYDNATDDEQDSKQKNIVNAVRDCFKTANRQDRQAVCSIGGPEVVVRDFKFPSLPVEEVEGAVLLEAAQVCPFDIEQATLDYQLISTKDENTCGILVAAKNNVIKRKNHIAKAAHLNCALMGVDGLEILNCFMELEGTIPGRPTAILNVGNSFANLVITGDDGVPFIRDISCAGNAIVEKMSSAIGIPAKALQKYLAEHDSAVESQPEFGRYLAAACRELIEAVSETVRYYAAERKSAPIEKIFVCGGFSQTTGFIESLNAGLPLEAVLWNPFDKIAWPIEQKDREVIQKHGPALALAAGLAMRNV